MSKMTINYRTHTLCKWSVRVTPSVKNEGDIKLPDIYITHDVLQRLGIKSYKDINVDITFETK